MGIFKSINKALKPLRGVGKVIGGGLDVVSDFLPPGLNAAGNITARLMQNKNLKSSVLGAGKDMALGKLGGMLTKRAGGAVGKLAGRGGGGVAIPNPDISAVAGAAGSVADKYASGSQFADKLSSSILPRLGGAVTQAGGAALAGGMGGGMSSNGNGAGGRSGFMEGEFEGGNRPGGSWFDKLLKSPGALEAGIGLAGSALSGYGQGKIADADRKWDKEKFGQELGFEKEKFGFDKDRYGMEYAPQIQRQMEMAPMRDRAMYMIMQRMGMPQQAFSPRDMFNPGGSGTQGGYDQNQLNAANAAYTPGAGGTNTLVQQQILKKLGYA